MLITSHYGLLFNIFLNEVILPNIIICNNIIFHYKLHYQHNNLSDKLINNNNY